MKFAIAVRERRGHRKAGAHRGIDLVRNPRDETTECGKSLGFNEVSLRFACSQSRFGHPPFVPDFGKQRSENQRPDRYKQNTDLSGKNALGDRKAWIAEIADAKRCRPYDRKAHDERGCRSEHRPATSRKPQQRREQQGDWPDGRQKLPPLEYGKSAHQGQRHDRQDTFNEFAP